jgi:hypothetical protein
MKNIGILGWYKMIDLNGPQNILQHYAREFTL